MADVSIHLAPGFRFHPTDEELINFYLSPKTVDPSYTTAPIGDADLNKCEPWDLPSTAKMGEKEWYFFSHTDRKYRTGKRTNRATQAGYWKATGKDKKIYKGKGVLVGMKKTLVFYTGRAPMGVKTNWVMHEYRIEGSIPRISQEEWVVSRIFHKNMTEKREPMDGRESSFWEEHVPDMPMPALTDANYFNTDTMGDPYKETIESNNNLFSNTSQYSAAAYPQILEQEFEDIDAVRERFKMQQTWNQSTMVTTSQDKAGLSTDWYTDIASLVPTKVVGCAYSFDMDDPGNSADPAIELSNICNY